MQSNLIPFKKYDRFPLTLGYVENLGEVIESEQVGFAFLKPGSKMFRLKIWMAPNVNYFLAQDEVKSHEHYEVLALEEYPSANGEPKINWNRVGKGILVGNYIKIQMQFFSEDFYLSLFPAKQETMENAIAL